MVRGWLGIAIQDLTDDLAAGFGASGKGGVLVADVMKDSPAESSGLKAGDVHWASYTPLQVWTADKAAATTCYTPKVTLP